jgi:photosystem II stability/assembly factor-like uncharacterized protein
MQVVPYKLFRRGTFPILLICFFLMLHGGAWAQEEQGGAATPHDNDPLAQMNFRFVGPTGGRTASITGVIGQPAVAYVGSANGGIYKTTDYGTTWNPIFDNLDVGSVGALAVATSAPNEVWAGTGEPWIVRVEPDMGDGIYKSTDEGRTWKQMGLEKTGHITSIVINPQDANTVYACSVGQAYKPGEERGIFKTTDGGKTWNHALFVNENTGCSDLVMDPRDPNTMFAGMWDVTIHAWDLHSGGLSSGVYVTHDAGATWSKISGHGLPAADHPLGRIGVNISPRNPNLIYALMEDQPPGFYRSSDSGRSWHLVSYNYAAGGRFSYDSRFGVSSGDDDLIYFLGQAWYVSQDGGKSLIADVPRAGGDLHNIWMDPKDPDHFMVSDDQGDAITWNGGKTYLRVLLPNSQLFHVATDNRIPYNVYGNKQDAGSHGGPSNNLMGRRGIGLGDWFNVAGSEAGFLVPDPADDNIFWVTSYYGDVGRVNLKSGESHMVSPWPDAPFGVAPKDLKYRYNWVAPLAISPHDHNRVYVGTQYVLMTTDAGLTWKKISPDLTLDEKTHEENSGGVTPYNLGTYAGETIFSIAESPLKAGVLWVGTADGQIQITQDAGGHWTNVTKNLPGLPPWGQVQNIEPSHFSAGTAYATVNLEQMGDYSPYVYKTSDFGRSWKMIASDIPKTMLSSPECIVEDPERQGMLYLGTDNAFYISWDDGTHWTHIRNNLPPTAIKWLTVQKHYSDLVMATYGRGVWILDDISPLREWDRATATDTYLFKPREAYRYRRIDTGRLVVSGATGKIGDNPPDGGDINFYLKRPAKDVQITISDSKGEVVRHLQASGKPGLNRIWWDLEYDSAHVIKLRTAPPGEPWVTTPEQGWRPVVSLLNFRGAPRVMPGTYTVKLVTTGKELIASLVVLRDPGSEATDQSIALEVSFTRKLLKEYNQVVDMVNDLEWQRKQLDDLQSMLIAQEKQGPAIVSIKAVDGKITALEAKMYQIEQTSASIEEGITTPMRLYEKLAGLLGNVDHGRGSGNGAGLAPTQAEIEVNNEYEQQISSYQKELSGLKEKEIPALNAALKTNGLGAAIAP